MSRAWDDAATRWNERLDKLRSRAPWSADSAWWIHAEADQTLAALDLTNGFTHLDQLARSAQSWLKVFVDEESPARETFARVAACGKPTTTAASRSSARTCSTHTSTR